MALYVNTAGNIVSNGVWEKVGKNVFVKDEKVGIGTTNPKATLEVIGGVHLGSFANNPTISEHLVVRSSGSKAFNGGMILTNSGHTTGKGFKFSTAFSNSTPGLRIGEVIQNAPNNFSNKYMSLSNGHTMVFSSPSKAFAGGQLFANTEGTANARAFKISTAFSNNATAHTLKIGEVLQNSPDNFSNKYMSLSNGHTMMFSSPSKAFAGGQLFANTEGTATARAFKISTAFSDNATAHSLIIGEVLQNSPNNFATKYITL